MAPKALKKLWHTIDVDGSGEIKVSEFAELLFPEVEGLSEDEEGEGGEGNVVTDPVLMKLIMQDKVIAEMTARMAYLCDALERVERRVSNGEAVKGFEHWPSRGSQVTT